MLVVNIVSWMADVQGSFAMHLSTQKNVEDSKKVREAMLLVVTYVNDVLLQSFNPIVQSEMISNEKFFLIKTTIKDREW